MAEWINIKGTLSADVGEPFVHDDGSKSYPFGAVVETFPETGLAVYDVFYTCDICRTSSRGIASSAEMAMAQAEAIAIDPSLVLWGRPSPFMSASAEIAACDKLSRGIE